MQQPYPANSERKVTSARIHQCCCLGSLPLFQFRSVPVLSSLFFLSHSHGTCNLAHSLPIYFLAKFNSDSALRTNNNSDTKLSCLKCRSVSRVRNYIYKIWNYIRNRKIQAEGAQMKHERKILCAVSMCDDMFGAWACLLCLGLSPVSGM